ncbi:MAG: hypothetical protein QM640_06010 [Niabella sp.]
MLKKPTPYHKITTVALTILWIGSLAFCGGMIYNWYVSDNWGSQANKNRLSPKDIFVDQLLLTSEDLQLGEEVNLININLNKATADTGSHDQQGSATAITLPERKLVYSKILQDKIKKISTKNEDGFTIKPLPQE